MPNQLTSAGLQIKANLEIVSDLISKMQAIYGTDINVNQNSPDGQMIGVYAQVATDLLEMLVLIYNSFNLVSAFGVTLDQRVALNGLARKAGTYSRTNVTVTVDRALTLQGLDADINNPDGTGFTVSDDAGNQFILEATHVFGAAGSASLAFRAKNIGFVETSPNTITNQVTVTLGVTAVNNPSSALSTGVEEETDAALKIRHAQSFMLAATGPADAIQAAIDAIPEVTDVFVAENNTASLANGVPAHGIWAIVENGADSAIGAAIYAKKAPGCAMAGAVSVVVGRPNGTTFTAKFDRPTYENLHIQFSINPNAAGITFDEALIKEQLVAALAYRLNQSATIGQVVVAMLAIAPLGYLTDVEVSKNGSDWFDVVTPTSFQHKFVADVARVTIL